jgi:hypothetical protein
MMFGGQVIGLELVDIRYFSVVAPPHFEHSIKTRSTTQTHPAQTATA